MAKNEIMAKVGSWSFLIGILIALIVGLYQAYTLESADVASFFGTSNGGAVAWVLAILGAIVGFLAVLGKGTITKQETPGFLLAGIALVIMYGVFHGIVLKPYIGALLAGISLSLAIFVAPTVGILAIKEIWDMGKEV
ncbi:MAG: hypothetical protein KAH91_02860 [Thermoplasmatales archaeon]|nr:hypothetical protein [Thermoplasmatales archaeon]